MRRWWSWQLHEFHVCSGCSVGHGRNLMNISPSFRSEIKVGTLLPVQGFLFVYDEISGCHNLSFLTMVDSV